jgi:hypothetical protein
VRAGRRVASVLAAADGSVSAASYHCGEHGRYVYALGVLLCVGVAAADGKRAAGPDHLAFGDEGVAARGRQQV